jgi:hypothetical protein
MRTASAISNGIEALAINPQGEIRVLVQFENVKINLR